MCANNGIIQRAYVYKQCAFFSLLPSICNYLLSNTNKNKIHSNRNSGSDGGFVSMRRFTDYIFFPLCTRRLLFIFLFLLVFGFDSIAAAAAIPAQSALRNNISTEQFSFGVGRTWCADSVYTFFEAKRKSCEERKKNVNKSRTTSDCCLGLSFGVAFGTCIAYMYDFWPNDSWSNACCAIPLH